MANWTSVTPSVATVGPSTGLATGVSAGSATISATIGSIAGTTTLSVVPGIWISTGSMVTARHAHTATLLQNGNVLAAGGFGFGAGSGQYFSGAEVYIPSAGTWSATGSMTIGRVSHTATLPQTEQSWLRVAIQTWFRVP
jgi:hypothetical protein